MVFVMGIVAQDLDDVTFSGRVLDGNGHPVIGATVTVTEVNTGTERSVVTNQEGQYSILRLKPGLYKLKAEFSGFRAVERTNIETMSGQAVKIDFALTPAGVEAEQTVVADEDQPLVDTSRTVVGGSVGQREIDELPSDSRDVLDLVLTLGGVTEEPLSTRDLASDRGTRADSAPGTTPEEAGVFALSGGAGYSNNITIDGFDNNDDRSAGFRFQPSINSVAELQVITNQFSSEYGRASGGRVNIRTRSGSNRYRGRAEFSYRDSAVNANTWNNNRRSIERAPFRNYVPSFNLGGPVVKDKLHFFTSYEYDRIQEDTIIDVYVPVDNTSNLSLPAPTHPEQAVRSNSGSNYIMVAPYIAFAETPARRHRFTGRLDWTINDQNNITVNYQLGRSNDLRSFSGTNRLADALIGRIRDTDAINVAYNMVPSSKAVNQLRFQYSKLSPQSTPSAGADAPVVLVSGFRPPNETSNATQIFNSSTSGSSDRKEDRIQVQNTFTYLAGNHTIKTGGDINHVDTQYIDRYDVTGTFRFSNYYWFSINSVSSFQQNFNTTSQVKNTYMGFFIQDDWKIKPNITLGLGLRYERESVISDNNNFGPRFSVAWNPFPSKDDTVIRFGAGIFYNRVLLRTIDDYRGGAEELRFDSGSVNVPAGTSVSGTVIREFLATLFPNKLTLDTMFPVNATQSFTVRELARPVSSFRRVDPNISLPESYQFNLGFERSLGNAFVFESNLTVNKTVKLWRETNENAPILPSGTPDRDGNGIVNWTDYLLGVTGSTQFELGPTDDTVGIRTDGGITWVNLNTTRNSDCGSSGSANTPVCHALQAVQHLRPIRQGVDEQMELVGSMGKSFYVGATFELRRRYRQLGNGFAASGRLVYTLSSLKDDGIVNTSSAISPGDFNADYTRSLLDRRHRIALSGILDTPNWMGGLRFSPIFRFGSSAPYNIAIGGYDRNLDDVSNDRPNFNGDISDINWRRYDAPYPESLANQFSLAPIGSVGNLPRNAGNGPRYYVFDLNMSRQFKLNERMRLRPSIEFGNVFNMAVFSFGSNYIDFADLNDPDDEVRESARSRFLVTGRSYRPRRLRFGIRFDF